MILYSYTESRESTNNASCYKQITLQILFSVHIDEHLLGVHLLRRKLSAVGSANLTQKSLLSVDTFTALGSVHRLRTVLIQRREFSVLTDLVDELHHGLGSQILLRVTQ